MSSGGVKSVASWKVNPLGCFWCSLRENFTISVIRGLCLFEDWRLLWDWKSTWRWTKIFSSVIDAMYSGSNILTIRGNSLLGYFYPEEGGLKFIRNLADFYHIVQHYIFKFNFWFKPPDPFAPTSTHTHTHTQTHNRGSYKMFSESHYFWEVQNIASLYSSSVACIMMSVKSQKYRPFSAEFSRGDRW